METLKFIVLCIAIILTLLSMIITLIELSCYNEHAPQTRIFNNKIQFFIALFPVIGLIFRLVVWFSRTEFYENFKKLGNEKKQS